MLEVQKYLKSGKSLDDLEKELGIKNNVNLDGRCILNYSMIDSPKVNQKVRECRSLTLKNNSWDLISRSFFRFFNASEVPSDDEKFNWNDTVICTSKEDGSLINVFWYDGEFQIQTRNSFGEGFVNDSDKTWKQLVLASLDLSKLNPEYSYAFELCSPYNKIVRRYNTPRVYLLSIFFGETELPFEIAEDEAKRIGVAIPDTWSFNSVLDVQKYIEKISESDKTFEGIVVRDISNNRLKIKSKLYLNLSHINNNGNLLSVKNIVPLLMAGEKAEILTYFPEARKEIDKIELKIGKAWREIDNVWWTHQTIKDQKKFAIAICKDTKFTSPLFSARKNNCEPSAYFDSDYVVKNVFGEKL